MQKASLDDLLQRSRSYESSPVAVSPALRRAGWMSIAAIMIGNVVYPVLPHPEAITGSKAVLVMEGWLAEIVTLVLQHLADLQWGNQAALLFAGLVLLLTDRFRRGRVIAQLLVLPIVLVGAANSFALGLMGSIVAVNLFLWALLVLACLTAVGFVLYVVYEMVF